MLVRTEIKHDLVCWIIAIGLHLLLLLVNFNLTGMGTGEKLIPIVEVEYVIPEELAGRVVKVGAPTPMTFKEKVKQFFSLKTEPAPRKKEEIMTGKEPARLEESKLVSVMEQTKLIDRGGSLSLRADLSGVNPKGDLISKREGEKMSIDLGELGIGTGGMKIEGQNLKDKGRDYTVARKDLPFELATRQEIADARDVVPINVGKVTSKDVLVETPTLKERGGRSLLSQGTGLIAGAGGAAQVYSSERGRKGGELISSVRAGEIILMGKTEGEERHASGRASSEEAILKEEKALTRTVITAKTPLSRHPSREEGAVSEPSGEKVAGKKDSKGTVIFEITGPLSRRKILHRVIPGYPEWAQKQGIEARVSVHFVVLSDGRVKDNLYIVTTSGYPLLDKLVMDSLREWLFASLGEELYGKEEWGILTFYFSLG